MPQVTVAVFIPIWFLQARNLLVKDSYRIKIEQKKNMTKHVQQCTYFYAGMAWHGILSAFWPWLFFSSRKGKKKKKNEVPALLLHLQLYRKAKPSKQNKTSRKNTDLVDCEKGFSRRWRWGGLWVRSGSLLKVALDDKVWDCSILFWLCLGV